MFKITRKADKQTFTVFSVRNDKTGYPHFLIYDKGMWIWKSAKHFYPTAIVILG